MKKISVFVIFVFFVLAGNAFSQGVQLGLTAGTDVVTGQIEVQNKQEYGILAFGGGVAYSDSDYVIGDALVALKSDQLLPGFKYGLGFKGLYGEVDEEDGRYDGKLAALGFLAGVDYELTSAFNPVEVPIEVYGEICFAPGSLSFEDTEKYQEYKAGFRFYVLESAFILVECKYRDIEFYDSANGDWSRDDTIFSAGITLRL